MKRKVAGADVVFRGGWLGEMPARLNRATRDGSHLAGIERPQYPKGEDEHALVS
jgi:hypothetical protein